MNDDKKTVNKELMEKHFRVSIFGSARLKPENADYKNVFELAKKIGQHGYDVITGGGPGLMEAASAGHEEGVNIGHNGADTIGLTIELPWEAKANEHLDMKKHFNKFSGRLDTFMALSNVVVITAGGIGTCLEFFYTLQLTQVKHICPIPIILHGEMWEKLLDWLKDWPVNEGLVSPEDLDNVYVAHDNEKVMKIICNAYKAYEEGGEDFCLNIHKYKLDE